MLTPTARAKRKLPWPLPALLAWALAWGLFVLAQQQLPEGVAFAAGCAAGAAPAHFQSRRWRQALVAGGFPLSVLALSGVGALPAWCWLAAALLLVLAYPLRVWHDAPFYPTARHALDGLDRVVQLPPRASILDAGCGAGDGLRALARVWPRARLCGVEWSRPLAWCAAWRVPRAQIDRGDMWGASWAGHDLVYLFQRPESMARAWAKACDEMRGGSWLVSLDFAVPGVAPRAAYQREGQRKAWIYRVEPVPAIAP